ncbi:protein D3-like [Daktulosphaira vitifoliae]|uniref:protein D3-like n=1 Tax=Daktulosphaira vitifoliae TaxID=58002 RepID=UPI0021AA54D1|nr:protein D3-like [Daktulosphaira vitifoliae]
MALLVTCTRLFSQVFTQLSARFSTSVNYQKIMEQHEIVPDVIPEAPKGKIQVSYPSGVNVDYGNELTPTQVKDEPTVKWDVEDNTLYTLCMTDPDAPSRKEHTYREWHHWLVGNIPGTEISKGETLSEYVGSGPPPNTGLHRYVFLVYKQPSKLIFNEPYVTNKSPGNRTHFSIHKFAQKYNLGLPVAGNFYQAQYDDYVPLRYKQPTTT